MSYAVRARGGRGRLGDEASVAWNYLFPSQASSLAIGQAQIQSVPQNAAAANNAAIAAGLPPPYDVTAIQALADQQSGIFGTENQQIWTAASNPPFSFDDISTWPWYFWLGLAFGGYWLLNQK